MTETELEARAARLHDQFRRFGNIILYGAEAEAYLSASDALAKVMVDAMALEANQSITALREKVAELERDVEDAQSEGYRMGREYAETRMRAALTLATDVLVTVETNAVAYPRVYKKAAAAVKAILALSASDALAKVTAPVGYASEYGMGKLADKAHHYCLSLNKRPEGEFRVPLYAAPPADRLAADLAEARKVIGRIEADSNAHRALLDWANGDENDLVYAAMRKHLPEKDNIALGVIFIDALRALDAFIGKGGE